MTLTLGEGTKTSYAEVLASARGKILLAQVGIEAVKMRKAMTSAIILEVPGDKDRKKASNWPRGWRRSGTRPRSELRLQPEWRNYV